MHLNAAGRWRSSCAWLDGTYEHSPWVAEARLGGSVPSPAMAAAAGMRWRKAVREGGRGRQLGAAARPPELAGKAMVARTLTAESTRTSSSAGLTAVHARRSSSGMQCAERAYNETVRLSVHPRGARPAGRRAPAGRRSSPRSNVGWRHPPDFRIAGGAAQRAPHRRDPVERQVRHAARGWGIRSGIGPEQLGGCRRPRLCRARRCSP
jgi:hypothetical protein